MEKYSTARQATDNNTERALCMFDSKATDTHSEHVLLIALPRQKWLREHA